MNHEIKVQCRELYKQPSVLGNNSPRKQQRVFQWGYINSNDEWVVHRDDGPAEITYYDKDVIHIEKWFQHNNLHREDGPSITYYFEDGTLDDIKWYKNGLKHREDGPQFIEYYEDGGIKYEDWYVDNKRHRNDGPAHIDYTEKGNIWNYIWYIDDDECSRKVADWLAENEFGIPIDYRLWTDEHKMIFKISF